MRRSCFRLRDSRASQFQGYWGGTDDSLHGRHWRRRSFWRRCALQYQCRLHKLDEGKVPVVAGFQGIDASGRLLTLGRGGSDTSAVAIGAALGADFVDIYKDVPGVAKADPRLVKGVPFMKFLDYDSMFRLANHGARVLHDKSALLAKKNNLRMRVRSTFDDGEGTLIGPEGAGEAVPAFLGLATTPEAGDRIRVTAVFAVGTGGEGVAMAKEAARNMRSDATPQSCNDPDAAVFTCARDKAAAIAAALFEALN
jgi:aspartate kinase